MVAVLVVEHECYHFILFLFLGIHPSQECDHDNSLKGPRHSCLIERWVQQKLKHKWYTSDERRNYLFCTCLWLQVGYFSPKILFIAFVFWEIENWEIEQTSKIDLFSNSMFRLVYFLLNSSSKNTSDGSLFKNFPKPFKKSQK